MGVGKNHAFDLRRIERERLPVSGFFLRAAALSESGEKVLIYTDMPLTELSDLTEENLKVYGVKWDEVYTIEPTAENLCTIYGGVIRNAAGVAPAQGKAQTYRKDLSDPYANVGRNDPCPCGSGKKFKNCHGKPGRR